MKSRVAALLLVGVLTAGAAAPAPSPEEEVLGLTRALLENIYLHPSAEFYAAHVAEDVTAYEGSAPRVDGIEFHLFALRQLGAQQEAEEAHGKGASRYLALSNPKVQVYGDTAIVTLTSVVTTVHDGEFRSDYLNETRVWVRRDGAWKLVHFHKSPLQPPSS